VGHKLGEFSPTDVRDHSGVDGDKAASLEGAARRRRRAQPPGAAPRGGPARSGGPHADRRAAFAGKVNGSARSALVAAVARRSARRGPGRGQARSTTVRDPEFSEEGAPNRFEGAALGRGRTPGAADKVRSGSMRTRCTEAATVDGREPQRFMPAAMDGRPRSLSARVTSRSRGDQGVRVDRRTHPAWVRLGIVSRGARAGFASARIPGLLRKTS